MQTVYANTVFVCKTYASCIQAMHTIVFKGKISPHLYFHNAANISHIYMGNGGRYTDLRSV